MQGSYADQADDFAYTVSAVVSRHKALDAAERDRRYADEAGDVGLNAATC